MPGSRPDTAKHARPRSGRGSAPNSQASRPVEQFPIVGIGASAGGLDACRKLVAALAPGNGMAFILVQHLDPTHESMMVDLLAAHTSIGVRQAADGMRLERDQLYVIPPATYLSVAHGVLQLSKPQAPHGARLPFDFLLHSLAEAYGPRVIAVILSGTGADGSLGIKTVKETGGLVIAQDPDEAGYDGMPRSAVLTGAVDLVLPAAKIPDALVKYDRRLALARTGSRIEDSGQDPLAEIIELLRVKTAHDFRLYKHGTLQRRIERRIAMAGSENAKQYLALLRKDAVELNRLAQDLLINITSFFRDPKVFVLLSKTIIPDLVRACEPGQALRIWIAGCSTGEETYSLAMLFREEIAANHRNIKLQLFASDVDPDAVSRAREGLYPTSIEADVSADRLSRFFSKEKEGYRILPELRALVVFTVQDLLADPPFSRLDLVSCRNLLIYLKPEAQAKVISLFHFALREDGVLLLGSSETVGQTEGRFKVISKPARIFRHLGHARPGDLGFARSPGDSARLPARLGQGVAMSRQMALADLCRRLVTEAYAPAAILINGKQECLYSLGPTDRYLRVPPGQPTHDVLAMVRQALRGRLAWVIQQARETNAPVSVVVRAGPDDTAKSIRIEARPVVSADEALLLICFVDEPVPVPKRIGRAKSGDPSREADLEGELKATRLELEQAIRDLEVSGEEQIAINEEALSVNEEFQSTNEELLTSKEELQSLNEELTALNNQLQETLERQRTTANDLQNILYSTDVATLFLDVGLNIRFFTPATKSLFNILPGDVGRPLADLNALAPDAALLSDAKSVLASLTPVESEVEGRDGTWYARRILPYRTQDQGIEGVVITFNDITDRRHTAEALEEARRQAEMAIVAKSRFLAAASHDLRQPLQTLALLQGLLAKIVEGEKAQKLVERFDETLGAMTGMLNTLLDINQIEAGTVSAEPVDFPITDIFRRLTDEFSYHAQAQGLSLRVVPCGLWVHSDPVLLEQMVRNLLSNALKYTKQGKVLLGCRRLGGELAIEIVDTGIGIPKEEFQTIFEEYHQVNNSARERNQGLGLGLSIVQRLADLLGHRVGLRSIPGKGSAFTITVALAPGKAEPAAPPELVAEPNEAARRTGVILVIEDDPEVSDLLDDFLRGEGHHTIIAADGAGALELLTHGTPRPDLLLADYNLPGGLNGLEVAERIREKLHRDVPVIMLTGDISTGTLRDIANRNWVQLNKPMKLNELRRIIERLLPERPPTPERHVSEATNGAGPPIIYVVDDDRHVRDGIREVLEDDNHIVEDYADCETFLQSYRPGREACLLVDASLPGMSGLELLQKLRAAGHQLPAIMITGNSDVPVAVQAMKAGASDFIEKPIGWGELLASVERALELSRDSNKLSAWRAEASDHVAGLTSRQRQIMELVLAGHPSKNIAADLGISQRTVENHRAAIMKRTGSKSLPALARLALAARAEEANNQ